MRKERKHKKLLGSRTHGYGSHKKHRGKGSKGGKGYAGSKGHRVTWLMKYEPDHIGKRGFKSLRERNVIKTRTKAINLDELLRLPAAEGKEIDAGRLGYDKILGRGRLDRPVTVKAAAFSKSAKAKIEGSGGKAVGVKEEK